MLTTITKNGRGTRERESKSVFGLVFGTASFFSSHLARRFFAVARDGRRDAEGPDSGRSANRKQSKERSTFHSPERGDGLALVFSRSLISNSLRLETAAPVSGVLWLCTKHVMHSVYSGNTGFHEPSGHYKRGGPRVHEIPYSPRTLYITYICILSVSRNRNPPCITPRQPPLSTCA